jgi:hypothetical protein
MTNNSWYDDFLDILYKKFPKKSKLTETLIELLSLEREAVYRRLRKEVQFSASEIIKIASTWKLSLDEIANINSEQFSFQLRQLNYLDPSEEEVIFFNEVIASLRQLQNYPDTEFMDICNKLPRQFIAGYEYLNRLSLFKWKYKYNDENEVIPFSQINISKEKQQITTDYYEAIKCVPTSNFIFDSRIFEYITNDIKYFHSIYLITDEENEFLKRDLMSLLDYLFEVTNRGYYPETQNKVNFYISQLNVDTNYSYTYSPEANICFIIAFEKLEIFSFNSEMVENFKIWMNLKKRSSIQISEVDERSRIEFFSKQKNFIESL